MYICMYVCIYVIINKLFKIKYCLFIIHDDVVCLRRTFRR